MDEELITKRVKTEKPRLSYKGESRFWRRMSCSLAFSWVIAIIVVCWLIVGNNTLQKEVANLKYNNEQLRGVLDNKTTTIIEPHGRK
jgi:hypothetical protein